MRTRTWTAAVLVIAALTRPAAAQSLRGFSIAAARLAADRAAARDSVARAAGGDSLGIVAPRGAGALTPIVVTLYADGNLRKAVQEGGGGQVAAGSLGVNFASVNWSLDVLINAAGSQDALRRGFGTTILAPGAGGSLSAGVAEWRYLFSRRPTTAQSLPPRRRLGLRAYASAGAARWQPDTTKAAVDVSVAGGGAGLFWAIGGAIPDASVVPRDTAASKSLYLVLDLGPAYRRVGGDAMQDANAAFRDGVRLNDGRRLGLEAGALIGYGDLKAGLTYYHFGGQMPGYSRGQVVAGFSVQTALASGALLK